MCLESHVQQQPQPKATFPVVELQLFKIHDVNVYPGGLYDTYYCVIMGNICIEVSRRERYGISLHEPFFTMYLHEGSLKCIKNEKNIITLKNPKEDCLLIQFEIVD